MQSYFEEKGAVPPGIREQFEEEDADRDGLISWEEFSGPKGEDDDEPQKSEHQSPHVFMCRRDASPCSALRHR